MTLKSLVTGLAAAAIVGGAAAGVTSVASPAIASADACAVDADTLQGVVDSLVAPGGDFAGAKGQLISPPLGIISGKYANSKLRTLYADGTLPTQIAVGAPTCTGNSATSQITAGGRTMPISFVNEGGAWKVTGASANSVLAAFG
ncbi:hypothetical protein A5662_04780 [Mycobacteriaceae bacterium 1482268.1]|nr:hypothetical protein A5662_04780 [Mycobacteriaceae bacterium 1482268.1]